MFPQRDQQLLAEAYSLQLLKEAFPNMTLRQVVANMDNFSITEKAWITEFSERVINELVPDDVILEFWGGAKALGKAAMSGIKGAGQAAGQAVGNAATQVGQGVKNVAQGVGAAAKQVGQNVQNIAQAGNDQQAATQAASKANEMVNQLVQMIQDAQAEGFLTFNGDPMTISLQELISELQLAQQGATSIANSTQRQGFTGGVKQAYQSAANQNQATA